MSRPDQFNPVEETLGSINTENLLSSRRKWPTQLVGRLETTHTYIYTHIYTYIYIK